MSEALHTLLERLAREGSSVVLTHGEDNGLWECSWITGGERFTSFASCPMDAALKIERMVAYPVSESEDRCPACAGTGIGLKPDPYVCRACGGTGLKDEEGAYGCRAVRKR